MMYNKTQSKNSNVLLFEGNKGIYEKSKTAYLELLFYASWNDLYFSRKQIFFTVLITDFFVRSVWITILGI